MCMMRLRGSVWGAFGIEVSSDLLCWLLECTCFCRSNVGVVFGVKVCPWPKGGAYEVLMKFVWSSHVDGVRCHKSFLLKFSIIISR